MNAEGTKRREGGLDFKTLTRKLNLGVHTSIIIADFEFHSTLVLI